MLYCCKEVLNNFQNTNKLQWICFYDFRTNLTSVCVLIKYFSFYIYNIQLLGCYSFDPNMFSGDGLVAFGDQSERLLWAPDIQPSSEDKEPKISFISWLLSLKTFIEFFTQF